MTIIYTKRLRVHCIRCDADQSVYVGLLLEGGIWSIACAMTVNRAAHIEFIETQQDCRRRGYATELWLAVERARGTQLNGEPVTYEGAALVRSILRRREQKGCVA